MSELNLRNERYGKLEYASLHVMEGDITSFLGLNYSGKELAVQILLGEIDLDKKYKGHRICTRWFIICVQTVLGLKIGQLQNIFL